MAINYQRIRASAKRMLTQNGTKFSGYRPGKIERVDGEEVETPDTVMSIIGVQTSYKPHEIDGKTILTGDRQIVSTADTEVKTGDFFVIDGQRWRVENPWPVKPAALLICYRIQLRGV